MPPPVHSRAIDPFRISHTDTPRVHRLLSRSTSPRLFHSVTCLLPTITSCTPTVQFRCICKMLEPFPFGKSSHCLIVGKVSRMYQVAHTPYLADQLSNAYDCYLAIIRESDRRISIELGREDRKWAMKNVCAPCLYKTEDEPKMKFEFLATMDGNNSLKLVDDTYRVGTVRTDTRQTQSPRWISPEAVDLFKDEVGKVISLRFMYAIRFPNYYSSGYTSRSPYHRRINRRSRNRRNGMAQRYRARRSR